MITPDLGEDFLKQIQKTEEVQIHLQTQGKFSVAYNRYITIYQEQIALNLIYVAENFTIKCIHIKKLYFPSNV